MKRLDGAFQKSAGLLFFLGAAQFIVGMMVSEALYPGYSIANNYISDLGVGPAALIFNTSVFLVGLAIVIGAYLHLRVFGKRVFSALFILAGLGAMGVGLFPEGTALHGIFALIAFVFAGISAIAAYPLQKAPLSYFSVLAGAIDLLALVLFTSGVHLGLGRGGMERMIVYPVLLWATAFGGYLMGSSTSSMYGVAGRTRVKLEDIEEAAGKE